MLYQPSTILPELIMFKAFNEATSDWEFITAHPNTSKEAIVAQLLYSNPDGDYCPCTVQRVNAEFNIPNEGFSTDFLNSIRSDNKQK